MEGSREHHRYLEKQKAKDRLVSVAAESNEWETVKSKHAIREPKAEETQDVTTPRRVVHLTLVAP